jgi:hypothetical protein
MSPQSQTSQPLTRRTFLRATGATLALPFLEALAPRAARASDPITPPRRMVCIMTNTGLIPANFFPTPAGPDYEVTRYMAHLAEHRQQMTLIGGVSHPDNSGGHMVEKRFLTGARFPAYPSFKNSISLDQLAAESIGHHTRFPFLSLGVNEKHDGLLSVTRNGVFLPPKFSPSKLYHRLFSPDTPEQNQGRTLVRRLTAQEIEYALRDLFFLPALRLQEALPEDERRHGYNKISEALDLSNIHLSKIMDAMDAALTAAIATRKEPPPVYRKRFYPTSGTETWLPLGRGDAVLLRDKQFDPLCPFPDPTKRVQDNNAIDLAYQKERMKLVDGLGLRQHEGAVGFFTGPVDKDFRRSLQFAPVHAGRYRIRTSAWSFWWDTGRVSAPPRTESFMLSVWLPEPGPRFDHSASRRLGMFDLTSLESQVHEGVHWLDADEELLFEIGTPTGDEKKTGRFPSSEPGSAATYNGPGIALDWYEVEGPLFEQWPPPSHRALFGDLPIKPFDPATGQRPPSRPVVKQIAVNARPTNGELSKEDTAPPLATVATDRPLEDAMSLMGAFLPRAFRRHISKDEILHYVLIVKQKLDARDTVEDAMREAYKM